MGSKLTKEEAEKIVKESFSIAECLKKMGFGEKSGSYKTFYRYKSLYDLDTSHFTGQGYMKGKKPHNLTKVDDYRDKKGIAIKNSVLLRKLIEEGYKQNECECCHIKKWNEKPIVFELHHIDGNHYNNNIENLQILCPNCHSQTDNFRGKNIAKKAITKKCEICGKDLPKYAKNKICKECYGKKERKVEWPTKEELYGLIKEKNFTQVSKIFGVSDKTIVKWCRRYGLPTKAKDYKLNM